MRIFEKAFTPPFLKDMFGSLVSDLNGNFSFQFETPDPHLRRDILNAINGKGNPKLKNVSYDRSTGCISDGEMKLILIRGWGYLTGTGGLNLSDKEAAEIQDDLANYIVEKLNG